MLKLTVEVIKAILTRNTDIGANMVFYFITFRILMFN